MKVLKKREIAFLIDTFVFAFLFVGIMELLKSWNPDIAKFVVKIFGLPILSLQLLRDLPFLNASLGKQIMGLRIYDDNWQKPNVFTIIKRSFITSFGGLAILYKEVFVTGNYISLFDFEAKYAHTHVIDKKVFETLKEEIRGEPGDFAKKMTEAYNRYLRDCYIKG